MAALLDALKTRIETLAITGWTVDLSYMSDDTDKRIAVYEYQGRPADHGFGVPGMQFVRPGIQVVVRSSALDYAGARAIAELVFQDFPKIQATSISGNYVTMVQPLQAPFYLRRDDRQRPYVVANYIFEVKQ